MSDQDGTNHDLSKQDITRRATFKLATAVAAFGVALGVRASTASAAQADMYLKLTKAEKNKGGGKAEKQEYIKKNTGQEKQEMRKFKLDNTRK